MQRSIKKTKRGGKLRRKNMREYKPKLNVFTGVKFTNIFPK